MNFLLNAVIFLKSKSIQSFILGLLLELFKLIEIILDGFSTLVFTMDAHQLPELLIFFHQLFNMPVRLGLLELVLFNCQLHDIIHKLKLLPELGHFLQRRVALIR